MFQAKATINIGIVGLGLIGGSLALDLQKQGHTIYGITHREESAVAAKKKKLAQVISTDLQILKNCSVIFLALPITKLLNPTTALINALPKNAVVSDVGSVKQPILEVWEKIHPKFIGSHPMAGTNQAGVDAGKHNLFLNKPWVVTPIDSTDNAALEVIKKISLSLGAKWIQTEPKLHDKAVGLISHLPVFISAALIHSTSREKEYSLLELAQNLASSGFKDTTRVGGGNPELGVAMAEANRSNLLAAIRAYKNSLDYLEQHIKEKDWTQLKNELETAKHTRDKFI